MGTKILNDFQERFCTAYAKTTNGPMSVTEVYDVSNMKPGAIKKKSENLLQNPKIKERIKELTEIKKNVANLKFQVTSSEILEHLDKLRRGNIADYIKFVDVTTTTTRGIGENSVTVTKTVQEVRFKSIEELTEDQKICIEHVKQTPRGIELKLFGKDWTIKEINKHIGFYFEKDIEQKTKIYDSPEARQERIEELKIKLQARDKNQK